MSRNLDPVTQSATIDSTQNFEAIGLKNVDSFSVQLNLSSNSSMNGTFQVAVSNDGTNFANHPDMSALTVNANGNHMYVFDVAPFEYVRAQFTRASGSIVASVIYCLKDLRD